MGNKRAAYESMVSNITLTRRGIMARGTALKHNIRYHTIIDGAMVYAVVHMYPIFRAVAVVSLACRSRAGRVYP